jgi:4-hydroxy-2-oxoheptanedioate aldolase
MGMSFGHKDQHDPPYSPEMADARARVKAACEANHIAFLNSSNAENITAMVEEGVRVTSGGPEAAEICRKYTKRAMPW